jgi:predicted MFS family arabinose efflux permease
MINNYGWQQVALVLGILSIVIGVVSSIVLRAPQSQEVAPNTMQGFKQVLSSSNIWILALANLLMVGSLEGFADVWGVQYLMTAYDISRADSAGLISLIFFGMLLGGPLLAKLSKKNGYYSVIVVCGFGLAVCLTLLLSLPQYNKLLISGVFFLVGIMCCYQVIVFSLGSSLVTKQNLGFTVALLNCINMLGGSFFHTSIGLIMDAHWGGALSNDGLRIYELITFKYGIAFVPLCALIGAIMVGVLWFKNTIRYKARVAVTG